MSLKDNRREASHYNDSLRSYRDVEVDLDVFENGSISTNSVHLCSFMIIGRSFVIVEPFLYQWDVCRCWNSLFVSDKYHSYYMDNMCLITGTEFWIKSCHVVYEILRVLPVLLVVKMGCHVIYKFSSLLASPVETGSSELFLWSTTMMHIP